jgi:hypothetical protein
MICGGDVGKDVRFGRILPRRVSPFAVTIVRMLGEHDEYPMCPGQYCYGDLKTGGIPEASALKVAISGDGRLTPAYRPAQRDVGRAGEGIEGGEVVRDIFLEAVREAGVSIPDVLMAGWDYDRTVYGRSWDSLGVARYLVPATCSAMAGMTAASMAVTYMQDQAFLGQAFRVGDQLFAGALVDVMRRRRIRRKWWRRLPCGARGGT